MNEWVGAGLPAAGRGGDSHHSGTVEGREPVWPVLSTTGIPGTPCSNVDRLTTISERIHLRGNQTKGKVGRVESLDQPHMA